MKNESFFRKELSKYDLTTEQNDYIINQMLDGVEIMTKKEITQCIEEHTELWDGFK